MGINWSNMWSLQGGGAEPLNADLLRDGAALDEQAENLFLERAARAVVRRRLTVPAVLTLESLRPLSFIGSQALLVLTPMLSLVFNHRDLQTLYRLLEKRTGIERFLTLIEEYDGES